MIWKKTISEKMHKNQFCKMIVMNNTGRINLDDLESRDEWINTFNKFLKNTYGLEQ